MAQPPQTPLVIAAALWLWTITAPGNAQAQNQQRISGEDFADFGKDMTGLKHYTKNGAMCVVHRPNCGLVGHNGKDHFFPIDKQLPPGATLAAVEFKVFWPQGIDHTDRGGIGSEGSYGADADKHFESKPPLYSVSWQNACEASTGANWSGLPITYQVSFTVNVPNGVKIDNAVSAEPASGDVCDVGDIPTGPAQPQSTTLASGWAGQVLFCNTTAVAVSEYLHIRATLVAANNGAQGGAGPMAEDNLPVQFPPGGVSGSASGFKTAQTYKQGTWKITDVYLTTSPTSPPNATVKNAVHLPGLPANPFSAVLPGNIGSPVFDFRGGSCF